MKPIIVKLKPKIALFSFFLCFLIALTGCFSNNDSAYTPPLTSKSPIYSVSYSIDESRGRLIGQTRQSVQRGKDASPVTVVPNPGYFLKWSDNGSTELTRQDTNIQHNIRASADLVGPYKMYFSFEATEGGVIEGATKQTVPLGADGEKVTAVPKDGYRFIEWSDGVKTAERDNKKMYSPVYLQDQSSWHIIAKFERDFRRGTYNYNGATGNNTEKDAMIRLEDLGTRSLPVPTREDCVFEGWYSDWHHTIQVTDETGKIIVGEDWFYNNNYYTDYFNPEGNLYAKWRSTKPLPTYKILLVFVTEIHADLVGTDRNMVKVDYIMTETEKKFCELITTRMEEYLNAIFNETVRFIVDSYFTKEVFTTKDIKRGTASLGDKIFLDYAVWTDEIPEIQDLLPEYGSILTTFCLNDWYHNLHITAGHAGAKYGNIHFDSVIDQWVMSGHDLDMIFDYSYPGSFSQLEGMLETYLHEFTHTIEMQLRKEDDYGLHEVAIYYSHKYKPIESEYIFMCDYLRGNFDVDGRKVGIPYEFWTGEYFNNGTTLLN